MGLQANNYNWGGTTLYIFPLDIPTTLLAHLFIVTEHLFGLVLRLQYLGVRLIGVNIINPISNYGNLVMQLWEK